MDHAGDVAAERESLLFFLDRLREGVIRTTAGLSEEAVRAPGVPSGTNLLGLVRHLTAMELKWFQGVFLGVGEEADASMRVPADVSREEIIAAYREACTESDLVVRQCPDLSTPSTGTARLPASTASDADPGEPRTVPLREIVAHMIEETARHAGHADILRELLDGATDL